MRECGGGEGERAAESTAVGLIVRSGPVGEVLSLCTVADLERAHVVRAAGAPWKPYVGYQDKLFSKIHEVFQKSRRVYPIRYAPVFLLLLAPASPPSVVHLCLHVRFRVHPL